MRIWIRIDEKFFEVLIKLWSCKSFWWNNYKCNYSPSKELKPFPTPSPTIPIDLDVMVEIISRYVDELSISSDIKDSILNWVYYNWENIFAFKQFPKEFQRIIYTSNLVEVWINLLSQKQKWRAMLVASKPS